MKKILLVCSIIFNTLAIIGAVYVLSLKGTVNAGYAVVPMAIGLACLSAYNAMSNKKLRNQCK
ncbi:MAG: hypothetical protein IJ356_06045 [Erysipelotrichaceae bacterium]|nr:hypothetical protein [Erysipelotrichaceae bacterium]